MDETSPKSDATNPPGSGPTFGSGFLAANLKNNPQGVVACEGVIATFYAWDLPCDRNAHLVMTVLDTRAGQTRGDLELLSPGEGERLYHQQITLRSAKDGTGTTITTPLRLHLPREGRYCLRASLPESDSILEVTFDLEKRPWPTFAKDQLDFLNDHPQTQRTLRVRALCPKCRATYEFEEAVDPKHKPALGTRTFPELGFMHCEHCGHNMSLRDLQGQLRQALLNGVSREMAQAAAKKK